MSCIFCDIVKRNEEASVVHETPTTLAFMNLNQLNDGHVLIIPKAHYENIFDIPEDMLADVIRSVKIVALMIKSNLGCEHLSIWQSNGALAGQDVWHLHFHILPRRQTGELRGFYHKNPRRPSRKELDEIAQRISGA